MAIHKSYTIAVDTIANQEAAGTSTIGAPLYLPTTSGSQLYLPYVDDGSNWQPWRANFGSTLFSTSSATSAWVLVAGAPESFGGANKLNCHKLDFTRFREARIYAVASGKATNAGNFDIQIVDITNTQNVTGTASFPNDGNWYRRTGTWTALNSATYAGDAEFEIQCVTGNAGETLNLGTIRLELR